MVKQNIVEFAKIASTSKKVETSCFEKSVYTNLPDILSKAVNVFSDRREKDVFLTGALGVLSGCFPNLRGLYDGREVYPNLFTYVSAPAASGKGVLAFSRYLGLKYHESLLDKKRENEAHQLLFIPGNTSAAAFMGHLQSSKNGVFFETEADTVGNTFKQDWGGFSDLLRKGYHHEPFSSSRKMNNEFIEIPSPKLSLVLSGTPEQIYGLVNSVEDGLFSRMTFYSYQNVNRGWKDVSPKATVINYKEHVSSIGDEIYEIINSLINIPKIEFNWSQYQWEYFGEIQQKFQTESVNEFGDEVISLVRRSGIMWYRISMILSILRNFKSIPENGILNCEDLDFFNAFELMNTYKEHNLRMFSSLPKQSKANLAPRENSFYNSLPSNFDRQCAVTIGEAIGLKERTVDYRLKKLLDNKNLVSDKYGCYSKKQEV